MHLRNFKSVSGYWKQGRHSVQVMKSLNFCLCGDCKEKCLDLPHVTVCILQYWFIHLLIKEYHIRKYCNIFIH